MTLTRKALAGMISRETGVHPEDVKAVLRKLLDHISCAIRGGERVELRGFGVFEARRAAGRVGRNPLKPGIAVRIPARRVVKFKPGKELAQLVMNDRGDGPALSGGRSAGDHSK